MKTYEFMIIITELLTISIHLSKIISIASPLIQNNYTTNPIIKLQLVYTTTIPIINDNTNSTLLKTW